MRRNGNGNSKWKRKRKCKRKDTGLFLDIKNLFQNIKQQLRTDELMNKSR